MPLFHLIISRHAAMQADSAWSVKVEHRLNSLVQMVQLVIQVTAFFVLNSARPNSHYPGSLVIVIEMPSGSKCSYLMQCTGGIRQQYNASFCMLVRAMFPVCGATGAAGKLSGLKSPTSPNPRCKVLQCERVDTSLILRYIIISKKSLCTD